MSANNLVPLFYPVLGAEKDLGFVRLSGHGLGNCFYAYFHSIALAERHGGRVIEPAWKSIKPSRLLRGRAGERSYWRLFRPHGSEVRGPGKIVSLLRAYDGQRVNAASPGAIGSLNLVSCSPFTFKGLHEHRDLIRTRLLDIAIEQPPGDFRWGAGGYSAVHVRLGDFGKAASQSDLLSGKVNNLRIPLEWYIQVVMELRRAFPDRPVRVLSDGTEDELEPLLRVGAELHRTGSDIGDLFALAGCSLLVGSNSTYSRWAAFLGNMPSIWLATGTPAERPTGEDAPIVYASIDSELDLSGLRK